MRQFSRFHSYGPLLLSDSVFTQYLACKGNYALCKTCFYDVFNAVVSNKHCLSSFLALNGPSGYLSIL